MKNFLKTLAIIIFVLVVDLTTKHFLYDVSYINVIPGVISFASNGGNTGAAFGMFSGNALTLAIVSVFTYFVKGKNFFYFLSLGFIIGGAIGNFFDRIFIKYVRDFICLDFFPSFPVFNFADSFLVVGAIFMAIFILTMGNKKSEK